MALYDDLNSMYASHNYFYQVGLSTISEAMDRCSRLTGEDAFVFQYQGMIVMCCQHALVDKNNGGVEWLTAVDGNPTE